MIIINDYVDNILKYYTRERERERGLIIGICKYKYVSIKLYIILIRVVLVFSLADIIVGFVFFLLKFWENLFLTIVFFVVGN